MPRLVYRAAALRYLAEIAAYIEKESGSRATADAFVEKLTDYCAHIATLPAMMGRSRPELRPDYRRITYGSYVISCATPTTKGRAVTSTSATLSTAAATSTPSSPAIRTRTTPDPY